MNELMNIYLNTKITLNVLYCENKYKNNKIYKKNINQLKIIKLIFTN